jgi:hypothetical protein
MILLLTVLRTAYVKGGTERASREQIMALHQLRQQTRPVVPKL